MEHDNDSFNNRIVAQTAATSGAAGPRPQTDRNWALVNCGPFGVRPRRIRGQFAPGSGDGQSWSGGRFMHGTTAA